MNIFIGWSGDYCFKMAGALKDWLGDLFVGIKPAVVFSLSSEPGRIWWNDLSDMLNRARGGILCLTRQSLSSTWLPFEAGRISAKEKGFVIPYCLNIDLRKIPYPLGLFTPYKADYDGTWILVRKLYEELPGVTKNYTDFRKRFKQKWPRLSARLDEISRERPNKGDDSQIQRFASDVWNWSDNNHEAEEIARAIPDINEDERFVIGLCGSAAIGKSTFAGLIARTLETKKGHSVSVLPTDAFSLPRAEKIRRRLQGYEPISHDLEKLNQSVGKLIAGKSVTYERYLHETGEKAGPQTLKPARILIVEGVYSFAPMNHHKIEWRPGNKVNGCRIYLDAEPGKAQELKFAADVTSRNKSVEEAFKELYKNYASYDRHIRKEYYRQTDFLIKVNQYWAYSS